MNMKYLGYLQHHDPLYDYFRREIQGQLGLSGDRDYRVFRLRASNPVYLYEESRSLVRMIGKFCYGSSGSRESARRTMDHEFYALNHMRSLGFDGRSCHYIARPLGRNSALNELLLEEYCYGETLSSILLRSLRSRDPGLLYRKLTALGYFLASFHNRTAGAERVDFQPVFHYGNGILRCLHDQTWLTDRRHGELCRMLEAWRRKPEMQEDLAVTVHGDATPENFLFGDGLHVISFDLERLRRADRLFDLGRITAELGHFFMLNTGNRSAAEPFIGHLLWEYCCHFPDRQAAFGSITARLPFYMGINYLRIARNSYFDHDYRQKLIHAGAECLKGCDM